MVAAIRPEPASELTKNMTGSDPSNARAGAFSKAADAEGSAPFSLYLEPMEDGWVRVRVEGELALTSSSTLERAVEIELLANSNDLLDLSGIDFIDSAGLRAMTAVVRMAKATGRELRLSADLPGHARRLMEIVGLLPFVPIGMDDPWVEGPGSLPDAPSV